jgi:hypothetical protein
LLEQNRIGGQKFLERAGFPKQDRNEEDDVKKKREAAFKKFEKQAASARMLVPKKS